MTPRCSDYQASYFAARRHFEDNGQAVDDAASEHLELEFRYQLLSRVLLASEETTRKLAPSVAMVRESITPNVAAALVGELERLSVDEVASWSNELRDMTLRRVATMLGLPMTVAPEELLSAVEAAIAGDSSREAML